MTDDLTKGNVERLRKAAASVDKLQDVDKADRSGPHSLTAALLDHLHDRLARRREAHGYQKREEFDVDTLTSIMKDGSIATTCAAIVAKGSTSFSEHQLVEAVTKVAHERHPGLSASAAFAKVYADQGDEGRVLREAVNVAKVSQWLAGGSTVYAKAADRGSNSAYGELMSKAEEYRSAHPELSISQAFEKIYTAPANIALRKRERVESAPR